MCNDLEREPSAGALNREMAPVVFSRAPNFHLHLGTPLLWEN